MNEPQTRLSAEFRRLEDENDDTRNGGVHLHTPSGIQLVAGWREPGIVGDTLATAKHIAAKFIDTLMTKHEGRDVDRINWPSAVAAIQRIVIDWNEKRRAALYAEREAADKPKH